MRPPHPSVARVSLSWILLCVLLGMLLIGGGASRSDALGQVVVRAAAWGVAVVAVLFGERPSLGGSRPVLLLIVAAGVLTLAQLIPLPPALWQALPGRAMFAEAASASGQAQPWRPWSIVPGATANAAGSLVIPAATLLLLAGVREGERAWLPGLLLILVTASTLLGLLQVSGAGLDNPLINEVPGVASGPFANRNHFALFLALGCALVPVWAFLDGRRPHWRAPVGFGLVLLFLLMILATGSRAGMGLGVLALAAGLLAVLGGVRREMSRYPRWVLPTLLAAMAVVISTFVLISVAADRAASISRLIELDAGQDLRGRALPTVLAMVGTYFPFGSGFGGFDPIFRIHEPFAMLNPTYFNHAHNDFVEVVLDGGLPALLLLLAALGWWGWTSVRVWRTGSGASQGSARLGSAMLLLILIASAFDYPSRTPIMMATTVVAALWLANAGSASRRALPKDGPHL